MYKQGIMEDFRKNTIDYKLLKKRVKIHSTAIVSSNTKIGDGSTIGAFSVIGDNVVIGNNCEIKSNVVIEGYTTIGDNNKIFPFAVIGEEPQDLKYSGEKSKIKIGNNNRIREHCTIHTGTKGDKMITKIGNNNLLMVNTHIAHDCVIGNNCILANNVTLGGHVHVGNYSVIGGLSAIHQKVHIGKHSMIGGMTPVEFDVIPYGVVVAKRTTSLEGINIIGLKRRNFSKKDMNDLRSFYKELFCSKDGNISDVLSTIMENSRYKNSKVINDIVKFMVGDSRRQVIVRR